MSTLDYARLYLLRLVLGTGLVAFVWGAVTLDGFRTTVGVLLVSVVLFDMRYKFEKKP